MQLQDPQPSTSFTGADVYNQNAHYSRAPPQYEEISTPHEYQQPSRYGYYDHQSQHHVSWPDYIEQQVQPTNFGISRVQQGSGLPELSAIFITSQLNEVQSQPSTSQINEARPQPQVIGPIQQQPSTSRPQKGSRVPESPALICKVPSIHQNFHHFRAENDCIKEVKKFNTLSRCMTYSFKPVANDVNPVLWLQVRRNTVFILYFIKQCKVCPQCAYTVYHFITERI